MEKILSLKKIPEEAFGGKKAAATKKPAAEKKPEA